MVKIKNMKYPKITLRAARVNAGFTLQSAAYKLGISATALRCYEKGKTVPNWETVDAIEKIYQFPSNFIFWPPSR